MYLFCHADYRPSFDTNYMMTYLVLSDWIRINQILLLSRGFVIIMNNERFRAWKLGNVSVGIYRYIEEDIQNIEEDIQNPKSSLVVTFLASVSHLVLFWQKNEKSLKSWFVTLLILDGYIDFSNIAHLTIPYPIIHA